MTERRLCAPCVEVANEPDDGAPSAPTPVPEATAPDAAAACTEPPAAVAASLPCDARRRRRPKFVL